MTPRTIRITGKGEKRYAPDKILIELSMKHMFPETYGAYEYAMAYGSALKELTAKAGIDPKELKTHDCGVRPHSEYVKCTDGKERYRLTGYEAHGDYSLRIPVDNHLLTQTLCALREHDGSINVRYILEERSKVNEEILALAVENAMTKAQILAKASHQTLGDIQSIDYSYGRIDIMYSDTHFDGSELICPNACGSSPEDVDIEPEDIDVSDAVTIVWELK